MRPFEFTFLIKIAQLAANTSASAFSTNMFINNWSPHSQRLFQEVDVDLFVPGEAN